MLYKLYDNNDFVQFQTNSLKKAIKAKKASDLSGWPLRIKMWDFDDDYYPIVTNK